MYYNFIRVFNFIVLWWSFSYDVYFVILLVFDFKVGFIDYDRECWEFSFEVLEYFNFVNIIDVWVEKEKVWIFVNLVLN